MSRETSPLGSGVVSVTFLKAGDAYNVIPDSVALGGTIRQEEDMGYGYAWDVIPDSVALGGKIRLNQVGYYHIRYPLQ